MKVEIRNQEIEIEPKELGLINRANVLSQSRFELIVADRITGAVYRRNTDWEWAGGNLYDPLGVIRPELMSVEGLLDSTIQREENFHHNFGVGIYMGEMDKE